MCMGRARNLGRLNFPQSHLFVTMPDLTSTQITINDVLWGEKRPDTFVYVYHHVPIGFSVAVTHVINQPGKGHGVFGEIDAEIPLTVLGPAGLFPTPKACCARGSALAKSAARA